MVSLTDNEKEALLILFKDFTSMYNANSISKILKMSRVGAQKMLKRFKKEGLVVSKQIGKSIIYKLNLKDDYVCQLLTFLLADEAHNYRRWKEEFKELSGNNRIIMMYGSAIKDYEKAKDIDLMIVMHKEDLNKVNNILHKKDEFLPKKLHSIKLTEEDLLTNLKKEDKVVVDIVRNAVILYGQKKYVEVVGNVARF